MSGGQQEGRALEQDADAVQRAAHALAEALKEAAVGFHGVRCHPDQLEEIMNGALYDSGWHVAPGRQRR